MIDLACGTGDFVAELENAGMVPLGFDFSMDAAAGTVRFTPLPIRRIKVTHQRRFS